MSELSAWLARRVWRWILYFMRLPFVRRFRRMWLSRVPAVTARRMIAQDRFARRHGEAVLRFSLTIMLASFAITACYFATLYLLHSGIIVQPRSQ